MGINWGRALMTGTSGALDNRRALEIAERLRVDAEARALASQQTLQAGKFEQQGLLQDRRESSAMSRLGVQQKGADARAEATREANQPLLDARTQAALAQAERYRRPAATAQAKPVKMDLVESGGEYHAFNPYTGAFQSTGMPVPEKASGASPGMSERDKLALEKEANKEFAMALEDWEKQRVFQFATMNPGVVMPDMPPIDDATKAQLWSESLETVRLRREMMGVGPSGNTAGLPSGKSFDDVDNDPALAGLEY